MGYPNSARALSESAVRARAGPGRFGALSAVREEQPEVKPYCACESCACCGGVVRAVGARALPGRPCARALPGRNQANRAGPGRAGSGPGPIYTMRSRGVGGWDKTN